VPHSVGDFKEHRSVDIWRHRARRKGAVIRHGMDDGPLVPTWMASEKRLDNDVVS